MVERLGMHGAADVSGCKQCLDLRREDESAIAIVEVQRLHSDPIARREFWDLIYRLSAAGHTVFVTTHYMEEAEYCHRLALMYRGKIIALGAPAELKRSAGKRSMEEVFVSMIEEEERRGA